VCLVAFSGACAVLGARFGSCEYGPPNFLYIIFFVLLLVVEAWQFRTAFPSRTNCREQLQFVAVCGLGCFEVLDFFTDGQQIAQAHLCDSDFHDAWVRSFDQAHSPVVGVVGALHLWGIFAVCQVLAVGVQGCIICAYAHSTNSNEEFAVSCSLVGLGGLQRAVVHEDKEEEAKWLSLIFRSIGVGLFETLPGLLLQPSLFALTFAHTDTAGQYKQLLSLAVSWAMALKAAGEVALFLAKRCKGMTCDGFEELFVATIFFGLLAVFVVGVFVTIGIGMMRVFHAYQCEDHVWNLFTGCVEL
jgi:hypothetical protein